MKVGVDSVLLGAWANVEHTSAILDVGTGTGLIALMLAQRSKANITAIEIEEQAAQEATENILASSWNNRVTVRKCSFQDFAKKQTERFDLVVSNPPFFKNAFKAASNERTMARHNDSLPFSALMNLAAQMINASGRVALIVPFDAFFELQEAATVNHLFLLRKTTIRPKAGKPINRLMLEWGKKETSFQQNSLTIFEKDGSFTASYVTLTKDFYLKF